MAKTIEQLTKEIFIECEKNGEPISMKEAKEMAEMEINAKEIKNYTQAEVEKKSTKKREVKLDEIKVEIIKDLDYVLNNELIRKYENIKIANPQKEITFTLNGEEYSITLIKHRKKKK